MRDREVVAAIVAGDPAAPLRQAAAEAQEAAKSLAQLPVEDRDRDLAFLHDPVEVEPGRGLVLVDREDLEKKLPRAGEIVALTQDLAHADVHVCRSPQCGRAMLLRQEDLGAGFARQPGGSLVTGPPYKQIGLAAKRSTSTPKKLVTLAAGATASAQLQIVDALNFPSATCGPTKATALKIYPPNQTEPVYLPNTSSGCAKPVQIMYIAPVHPGSSSQ